MYVIMLAPQGSRCGRPVSRWAEVYRRANRTVVTFITNAAVDPRTLTRSSSGDPSWRRESRRDKKTVVRDVGKNTLNIRRKRLLMFFVCRPTQMMCGERANNKLLVRFHADHVRDSLHAPPPCAADARLETKRKRTLCTLTRRVIVVVIVIGGWRSIDRQGTRVVGLIFFRSRATPPCAVALERYKSPLRAVRWDFNDDNDNITLLK